MKSFGPRLKSMENNKLLSLLGFAQKAGKLATGDETCELYLKRKKVKLILIASDAAENTLEKWRRAGQNHNVPVVVIADREVLSNAIGKVNRTVIAVLDSGFAKQLEKLMRESGIEKGENPGGDGFVEGKNL